VKQSERPPATSLWTDRRGDAAICLVQFARESCINVAQIGSSRSQQRWQCHLATGGAFNPPPLIKTVANSVNDVSSRVELHYECFVAVGERVGKKSTLVG